MLPVDTCIPRRVIHLWGYHDSVTERGMSDQARQNRVEAMRVQPHWSHVLLAPEDVLLAAARLPPAFAGTAVSALTSPANAWITKADIARVIAVYDAGGVYFDLADIRLLR